MIKKTYYPPEMNVYTINDVDSLKESNNIEDIYKVGSLIRGAKEKELSDLFSNWIDKDIKRQSDILELYRIKWDIDNYKDISDINSIPNVSATSHWQSAINIFNNLKEEIIWEIINFIDIPDCIDWICNDIRIIQPQTGWKRKFTNEENVKNIWFKYIIPTIRNWLMHNRYLITKNGLYIHSEKAWRKKTSKKDEKWNNIIEEKDFEAFVDLSFFYKIINFSIWSERKQHAKVLDISKINWKQWFEENVRNLNFRGFESKEKWLLHNNDNLQDKLLNRMDETFKGQVKYYTQKLPNGHKQFMSEYFKTHEFNRNNLEFIGGYLSGDTYREEQADLCNDYVYVWIDSYFLQQKENFQICFRAIKDVIFHTVINSFLEWNEPYEWKIRQDDIEIKQNIENKLAIFWICKPYKKHYAEKVIQLEKTVLDLKHIFLNLENRLYSRINFRKNYLKVLYLSKFYVNNPKLELAQPEKRTWDNLWWQWYYYLLSKCKENPNIYWSNEVKKNKIDQAIWSPFRERLLKRLTIWKVVDNWIIKNTENINQIIDNIDKKDQFITKSTKNLSPDNKKIVVDNIKKVIKDWKEKLDNITIIWEEEHIRNAFAHHNYTIVPWFNKILLRDPSIDDSPDWENVYDLDELYENAVGRVDEDYLDKKVKA